MTIPEHILESAMDDAIDRCTRHVASGGLPFAGVVVDPSGRVTGFGVNRERETGDPTAHAEVVAMREAMAATGPDSLSGSALLATGEPCGLCYRFALDHGIHTVHVAVDRDSAAGWGFDYRGSYRAYGISDRIRADVYRPLPRPGGDRPFRSYRTEAPWLPFRFLCGGR